MAAPAIRVEGLSKQYQIGAKARASGSLREAIMDVAAAPARTLRSFGRSSVHEDTTIWALDDVSFEVAQGEVIGIIGRNGAGKSTLLKILTRITEPTSGTAEMRGRVGSLLEVGTGFHLELTGRENVFLSGALLGMSRAETKEQFDQIVDFSGASRFIDTPVKRYSSGMRVRLGFAVAAHLRPEILLIDEVLAVGDVEFQRRCLGKMGTVAEEGRTVLFVSHNMQAVRALCPRTLVLGDGKILADAPTSDAIQTYYGDLRRLEVDANTEIRNPKFRRGNGDVRFTQIRLEDDSGSECPRFVMGGDVRFALSYEVTAEVEELHASIVLHSALSGEIVTSVKDLVTEGPLRAGHQGSFIVELPNVNLRPGEYRLYFWLGNREGRPFDVVDDLTVPLIIFTDKGHDELGFDPSRPQGFFNIDARISRR